MPLNKKEKKMRRCSVVLENTCTGFPGTTTQQLPGRDQLRAVLMCHPVVLFVSRKQYLTRQKPSLWTGPGFPTAGTRGTGD